MSARHDVVLAAGMCPHNTQEQTGEQRIIVADHLGADAWG
jgi:hypothetical protein